MELAQHQNGLSRFDRMKDLSPLRLLFFSHENKLERRASSIAAFGDMAKERHFPRRTPQRRSEPRNFNCSCKWR